MPFMESNSTLQSAPVTAFQTEAAAVQAAAGHHACSGATLSAAVGDAAEELQDVLAIASMQQQGRHLSQLPSQLQAASGVWWATASPATLAAGGEWP
jgi:hypothetical protein